MRTFFSRFFLESLLPICRFHLVPCLLPMPAVVHPVPKKFCDRVVLESIFYRTKTKRVINETNTTSPWNDVTRKGFFSFLPKDTLQEKKKFKTEHIPSEFFSAPHQLYCSRLSVVLLLYDSRLTLIRRDGWEKFERDIRSSRTCMLKYQMSPPPVLVVYDTLSI